MPKLAKTCQNMGRGGEGRRGEGRGRGGEGKGGEGREGEGRGGEARRGEARRGEARRGEGRGGEGRDDGYTYCNRPLSRRLDRCDRMIQNEGNDSRKLFTLKIALCR